MSQRIAVYEEDFDPFGKHHQEAIRYLVEQLKPNVILIVPSVPCSLKTSLSDFTHRYNMAKLGVNDLKINGVPSLSSDIKVRMSTIEMDMLCRHPSPIKPQDLLKELYKRHPGDQFYFVSGVSTNDMGAEEKLTFVQLPSQILRSNKLRETIHKGYGSWEHYVPSLVLNYIRIHRLYEGSLQNDGT